MKKKEMTAVHLIDVSFELFAEHGIEKTSLGMIAQKAGMTKSSIYYHFASKEELISSTFDHMFAGHQFSKYFHIESVNADNFVEVLLQGGLRMLPKQDADHHTSLRVLNEFMTLAERDESFRQRIMAMHRDFIEGFHQLLIVGAEWGVLKQDRLEEKATLLALNIDQLSRCMMLKFELDYPVLWREAVSSLIHLEQSASVHLPD